MTYFAQQSSLSCVNKRATIIVLCYPLGWKSGKRKGFWVVPKNKRVLYKNVTDEEDDKS